MKDVVVLSSDKVYKPTAGSYGVPFSKRMEWFHCREQFHLNMGMWSKDFGFAHKIPRKQLIEFIDKLESRLNLKVKTKIFQTNFPGVSWIEPSPFWKRQLMRFQFFTIALRSSSRYDGEITLEEVLKSDYYLSQTWRAVEYFLNGRNHYTGYKFGWMTEFGGIDCCDRKKCIHKDRKCRKKLDDLLVVPWQTGLHEPIKFFKLVKKAFLGSKKWFSV